MFKGMSYKFNISNSSHKQNRWQLHWKVIEDWEFSIKFQPTIFSDYKEGQQESYFLI
jgi:hypothetical protein